ncbi:DUF2164 domain-containing protein [Wukongibacter baidiensis]|uniref:DUF2164 domain-containing protein n=1 Tax=Wukongibacter baidiensis TaxID=1723361 RepID=UPI003D7FDEE3
MNKIELSKEHKKNAVEEIKKYFDSERDEQIGDLQAELILDFIIDKVGPQIYNQAISDMQRYMSEKVDDMYAYMI